MNRKERHQTILKLLEEDEFVSVTELSKRLGTSLMTIRRDLEHFEHSGTIRRVHGGAVLQKVESTLPPFMERFEHCIAEKNAIGKAALQFIKPDCIACFDSGTTTLAAVRQLPPDAHFTAITTGVRTTLELSKFHQVNTIQVGGSLDNNTLTICNELSTRFIRQFRADLAILSARALESTQGTFDINLVAEKRDFTEISQEVIILADHTKFHNTPLCLAVPLEQIDIVITDDKTEPVFLNNLRERGVEVIVASPEEGS